MSKRTLNYNKFSIDKRCRSNDFDFLWYVCTMRAYLFCFHFTARSHSIFRQYPAAITLTIIVCVTQPVLAYESILQLHSIYTYCMCVNKKLFEANKFRNGIFHSLLIAPCRSNEYITNHKHTFFCFALLHHPVDPIR